MITIEFIRQRNKRFLFSWQSLILKWAAWSIFGVLCMNAVGWINTEPQMAEVDISFQSAPSQNYAVVNTMSYIIEPNPSDDKIDNVMISDNILLAPEQRHFPAAVYASPSQSGSGTITETRGVVGEATSRTFTDGNGKTVAYISKTRVR